MLTLPVPLALTVLAAVAAVAAVLWSAGWWAAVAVVGVFALLAWYDVIQPMRPEIQQYFIERNVDDRPFDRDTRSVVYERAKGIHGELAFGTEREVNEVGYEWVLHSNAPAEPPDEQPRVRIGGPDCKPYDMALLNADARQGGFAHDTGEGGLTQCPLENGGAPAASADSFARAARGTEGRSRV